jgi:uncharacterized protein
MVDILNSFELTSVQWTLILCCALMIGVTKAGVAGLGMLIIPIMASIFDPKLSVGILLPMLIIGDIVAAKHYRKDADWKHLIKLVPWVAIGIACGVYVGNRITAEWFRYLIAIAIFVGLIPMIIKGEGDKEAEYPNRWWFSALFGLAAGFFTMVGNAAGALMSVYLLSMHLPKNRFIGTRAWFFLIVNLVKVPLHIFIWGTITVQTITLNAVMIPLILLGALFGIKIVKKINEKVYRYFIIILIVIAALKLLVG